MQKSTIKMLIIISCGALLFFLLFRFLSIKIPIGKGINLGMILAFSLISLAAIKFGKITGGVIGLFGYLLFSLSHGGFPVNIVGMTFTGFYAFLVGAICQKYILKSDKNNIIKSTSNIFLIIFLLMFAAAFIQRIVLSVFVLITNLITNYAFGNLNIIDDIEHISWFIGQAFSIQNIMAIIKTAPIEGLIVAVICSLSVLAFILLQNKKGVSDFVERFEQGDAVSQSFFEGGIIGFLKRNYRMFFEIYLWFCLIFHIDIGQRIGPSILNGTGGSIIGLIIGAIAGVIYIIFFGGLIATFLNINKNLEIIALKGLKKKTP